MHFSFSTVYMAIIASNVLLILLTFCFRSKKLMVNIGYRLLAIFSVITLIRFLLPIELTVTRTILLPAWISSWLSLVRHGLFYIGEFKVSLWAILLTIWLLGFGLKLVLYIRKYLRTRYHILSHMWDVTGKERYQSILTQVCREQKKPNSFVITEVAGLKVPMLFGMFKPHILLPKEHSLSDTDLYYIFAHEASHHFHHDLVTKFIIRLICMIYWWNPFCNILAKQTDTILEMRIDDVITVSDAHTIKGYLECLTLLTEQVAEDSPVSEEVCMPLLPSHSKRDKKEKDGDITKRFEMLVAYSAKKNHFVNLALLLVVVAIYVSSYAFILEAHYALPDVAETTMAPSEVGIYAIQKEDNTYDIYYGDTLMENTDSLELYPGIPIYTEKENYDEQP